MPPRVWAALSTKATPPRTRWKTSRCTSSATSRWMVAEETWNTSISSAREQYFLALT